MIKNRVIQGICKVHNTIYKVRCEQCVKDFREKNLLHKIEFMERYSGSTWSEHRESRENKINMSSVG